MRQAVDLARLIVRWLGRVPPVPRRFFVAGLGLALAAGLLFAAAVAPLLVIVFGILGWDSSVLPWQRGLLWCAAVLGALGGAILLIGYVTWVWEVIPPAGRWLSSAALLIVVLVMTGDSIWWPATLSTEQRLIRDDVVALARTKTGGFYLVAAVRSLVGVGDFGAADAVIRKIREASPRTVALTEVAIAHARRRDLPSMRRALEDAERAVDTAEDVWDRFLGWHHLVQVAITIDDQAKARRFLREAHLTLSGTTRALDARHWARLTELAVEAGADDLARTIVSDSKQALKDLTDPQRRMEAALDLARASAITGDFEQSIGFLNESVGASSPNGLTWPEAAAVVLGDVCRDIPGWSDRPGVPVVLDRALSAARGLATAELKARAFSSLARATVACRRYRHAGSTLAEAELWTGLTDDEIRRATEWRHLAEVAAELKLEARSAEYLYAALGVSRARDSGLGRDDTLARISNAAGVSSVSTGASSLLIAGRDAADAIEQLAPRILALARLGEAAGRAGHGREGSALVRRAAGWVERIQDDAEQAGVLCQLAQIAYGLGEKQDASTYLWRAEERIDRIATEEGREATWRTLTHTAIRLHQWADARKFALMLSVDYRLYYLSSLLSRLSGASPFELTPEPRGPDRVDRLRIPGHGGGTR